MRGDRFPVAFAGFGRACAAFLFVASLVCVAQESQPAATQKVQPTTATQKPAVSADSKQQTSDPAKQTKQEKAAAAANERKKQIADESTKLLSMALALKAEVDKTTKDTLSINVIRKADEIEKLAHNVKEKIKQDSGAS